MRLVHILACAALLSILAGCEAHPDWNSKVGQPGADSYVPTNHPPHPDAAHTASLEAQRANRSSFTASLVGNEKSAITAEIQTYCDKIVEPMCDFAVGLDGFVKLNHLVAEDIELLNNEKWRITMEHCFRLMDASGQQFRMVSHVPPKVKQIHGTLIAMADEENAMAHYYTRTIDSHDGYDANETLVHAGRLAQLIDDCVRQALELEREYMPNDHRLDQLASKTTNLQKQYHVMSMQPLPSAQPNFVVR